MFLPRHWSGRGAKGPSLGTDHPVSVNAGEECLSRGEGEGGSVCVCGESATAVEK